MLERLREYNYKKYDFLLLLFAIMLGAIGAYMLKIMPGVQDELYIKQIKGIGLGVCIALFVSFFDYHFVSKFYIVLYLFNLGLLILVKFSKYGIAQYGAQRWLGIKEVFQFQPSELTKVIMIVVMAKFFSMMKNRLNKLYTLILACIIMGIPTFLVLIQTDLSTSIVLGLSFVAILFVSGYSIKILLFLTAVGVPVVMVLFWYIQQPGQVILTKNQQNRVLSLLHPEAYPTLIYQQDNAVKAMRSGGLMGKLFTGDTGVRGIASVPVRESDFIFTAIGEELGFIGSVIIILLIMCLAFRVISIGRKAEDTMGRMIAIGCASVIMVQSFVNIGVVSMILPNTGIPLPFISNGLSSVLSSYIMLGLVLNISINSDTKKNMRKGLHE